MKVAYGFSNTYTCTHCVPIFLFTRCLCCKFSNSLARSFNDTNNS